MGVRLLFVVVNWRSTFKPALCFNRRMEEEWAEEDSVLAGADVCKSFSPPFFLCWLWQRGFFVKRFHYDLSGVTGCGSCLAFLVRKIGRGPDQESTRFCSVPDSPTPDPSPN